MIEFLHSPLIVAISGGIIALIAKAVVGYMKGPLVTAQASQIQADTWQTLVNAQNVKIAELRKDIEDQEKECDTKIKKMQKEIDDLREYIQTLTGTVKGRN